MKRSYRAIVLTLLGGAAACGARSSGELVVDADTGTKMSTSTHTGALERSDTSSDADAHGVDRRAGEASAIAASLPAESDGESSLIGEERERDPRSDMIKIKVMVDARRQAHVIWGRKDFGLAPLEIERPRNSGPLDLVVVAPGYLPHHARAFTDRDDVVSLRLYSAAEAPQMLGYRSSDLPKENSKDQTKEQMKNQTKDQTKNLSKETTKKVAKEASPESPKKK
jgi:hypothetical protein